MLQRIQTLYLLAVAALMSVLCFVPMVNYTVADQESSIVAFNDFWWVGVLFAISALVAFVVIWLYKNRLAQIRLLCAEIVLLVGSQAFALWYSIGVTRQVAAEAAAQGMATMSSITTPTFFPLVCVILVWLAIRAIWKDERLVRSLDRIR